MAKRAKDNAAPEDLGLAGLKPGAEPQGLSLDRLSSAFAEMLSSGDDPYHSGEGEPLDDFTLPGSDEQPDAVEVSPLSIFEAMLFVGSPEDRPLTAQRVASLMRGVRSAEIEQLAVELNQRYAADRCPYEVVSNGAGYRLALRNEFSRVRDKFYGRARRATLSSAAIEVLSIVAYQQPITADGVARRRGTPSGAVLSQLVRRRLLRIERPDTKPRTGRYFTTERFLQLFGLRSLDDLPRSQDDLEKQ